VIVREMGQGRILCIPQTTHGLMAAQFVRHWGNQDFPAPCPYAPVMMAIAQHDSGWFEWEQAPQLQEDGRPMDFITYTDQAEKSRLWQRGIDRAYAQHPYAALLISHHASILYRGFQGQNAYSGPDEAAVNRFLAEQDRLEARVRQVLAWDPAYAQALSPGGLAANVALLQFGDRAALQVAIPWASDIPIGPVPTDRVGGTTQLQMRFDETTIHFAPWPYALPSFPVHMEGYLLEQDAFPSEEAYHAALNRAPLIRHTWQVAPG
jgi:hypothetical protein